ncbi:unnamed protein product [Discula destructiva]
MKLSVILCATTFGISCSAGLLEYTIEMAPNPTADELDAYIRIAAAMDAAIARHEGFGSRAAKKMVVEYNPVVPSADGSITGLIRFGSNRQFMTEFFALHEIAHTLGVGLTPAFRWRCDQNEWPTAGPLLQSIDGPDARIECDQFHFWPYGLNLQAEMNIDQANRHVVLLDAMIADGIGGTVSGAGPVVTMIAV